MKALSKINDNVRKEATQVLRHTERPEANILHRGLILLVSNRAQDRQGAKRDRFCDLIVVEYGQLRLTAATTENQHRI